MTRQGWTVVAKEVNDAGYTRLEADLLAERAKSNAFQSTGVKVTDHNSKYGTDTAAYLAYKAAVVSVGAFPIPAAEFAVPADVMRHIVLVVRSAQDRIDAAKAMHVTLAEPENRSWWAWPWR